MEDIKKEVQKHDLLTRWRTLDDRWDSLFPTIDAIWVENGIEDEEVKKLKTSAMQNWLLRVECLNSVQVITKKTMLLFMPADRLEVYAPHIEAAKLAHKEIIFIAKNEKAADGNLNIKQFFDEFRRLKVSQLGAFCSDRHKGKLIELTKSFLAEEKPTPIDISKQIQEFLSKKDSVDLGYIEKGASVTCHFFNELLSKVLNVIESNENISHVKISKQVDELLNTSRKRIAQDFKIVTSFYDFSYAPIIQSGGKYDLRPNVENRDEPLAQDCILLNLGGKYLELNCNIYRTLMINPEEQDKTNYQALYALHKLVISKLTPGKKLSEIYNETLAHAEATYPDLKSKLPVSLGFGIGYEFKESCLVIKSDNDREVQEGHVYAVITSLKDLKGFGGKNYALHLSDTIEVRHNKAASLTDSAPKRLEDIAYTFEDSEEPKPEKKEKRSRKEDLGLDLDIPKTDRNAKRTQMIEDHMRMERMREKQKVLLARKNEEVNERFESGNFNFRATENTKVNLEKLQTYTSDNFPKGLNPRSIAVDAKNSAVLLPINDTLVPFHISCIKNVVKHQESKGWGLRFNFQIPGIAAQVVFPSSTSFGSDPIYIKELNFKSNNGDQMNHVQKQIKDLQKKQRSNVSLSEHKDEKVTLRNRIKVLNDLKMRPAMTGKKTIGALTAFSNGFRFNSKRNEVLEIALSNIKSAIFQKCDDKMIIIIHFVLRNPIMINKKATTHIQFFTEVGFAAEDLHDPKMKNRMNDFEELQEEELERKARDHYNNLFLDFVTTVEKNWETDMKFDCPFPELGFYASTSQNNVFIMPTANSLVSLIEAPFLVMNLEDIEFVSIERVDNKIKNFDMIVIFKDYSRPVQSLSSIEKTYLNMIKEWLNEQDILFMDGGVRNLKWDNLLKKIRSEPAKFIEEGGWGAFFEEDEEEESDQSFNEEDSGEGDSAFDEEEDGEDDDDDDDDSDLYDSEEDEESLEEEEEEEEEEFSDEESEDDKKKKNKKRK